MRLSTDQQRILLAIANGYHLKSHRYLDGEKVDQLHSINGSVVATVEPQDVKRLVELGLLTSNMKFPAATYMLTKSGASLATTLS